MNARERVLNYSPRWDVARLIGIDLADEEADLSTWSVYLSPDATVIELAVLMVGLRKLGLEVGAEPVGDEGAFFLRPLDETSRAPTGRELAWIIERGFPGRLPTILLKQAG